jgi:hypothetical protein
VPVSKFNAATAATTSNITPVAAEPASAVKAASGIGGVSDWYLRGMGDSCPRIPAPAKPSISVGARGIVTATWPKVGTDVWYFPYICDETVYDCSTTTSSHPWYAAWATPDGNLWSNGTNGGYGLLDPIGVMSREGHNTSGHEFAVYIRSFGAGNPDGGGNSPVARVTVSR